MVVLLFCLCYGISLPTLTLLTHINGIHAFENMLILKRLFKRKPPANSETSQSSDSTIGGGTTAAGAAAASLPERPIGLRCLHEPKTETNIVSIVFVHGLGGSARLTWTHSPSQIFWPNLLHEDDRFANVRISTFGYDSDFKNVLGAKNVLGIPDFAKQLLDALDLYYDKYHDVRIIDGAQLIQTPTIFVAHSMGGLVVKKVLCLLTD